jgi:DNA polymerase III subunit delta'
VSLVEFEERYSRLCARLRQTRLTDRVGQAYLFVGDDVPFLERFVGAWAEVCACLAPGPDGDACGSCPPCIMLKAKTYPDKHELRPQSKSRQILIGDVRGLEHQLGLSAARDRMKVGIIVEADRMGDEAQNAFLKTLEEPAPRTILMLLTAQPKALLPTIRSRCQVVSLLQNRRSYDMVRALGLFELLGRLRRGAGAAQGLAVAADLDRLFGHLRNLAEEQVGDSSDERWATVATDDKALKKRLEEQRVARQEAEYVRLRHEVADAIQTWFLQQALIAAGAAHDLLPHPEILEAAGLGGDRELIRPEWGEAEQALAEVSQWVRALVPGVNERLALEVLCLALTEKSSSTSKKTQSNA